MNHTLPKLPVAVHLGSLRQRTFKSATLVRVLLECTLVTLEDSWRHVGHDLVSRNHLDKPEKEEMHSSTLNAKTNLCVHPDLRFLTRIAKLMLTVHICKHSISKYFSTDMTNDLDFIELG